MIDEVELKKLHMRDPVPVRLGNLASSVKRLGFLIFSKKPEGVIQQLLQECQLFLMWTFSDSESEINEALSKLQHDLQNWENNFQSSNGNEHWRVQIAAACETWSNRLLDLSGLLKTGLPAR